MAMTCLTLGVVCVLLTVCCVASPTRRQFTPETSSTGPAVVTGESEVWDDTDDFDMEGDEEWLGESAAASPSSIPLRQDYDDFVDDSSKRDDDDDVEHQDAEEDDEAQDRSRNPEFLFVPSSDSRLMLQDDDADQSGLIKVRHTGKNAYTEMSSNSLDDDPSSKDDDDEQFEFTLGGDDESDKDDENDLEKDDFVLEDSQPKDIADDQIPRRMTHYADEQRRGSSDDDGDDDDDTEDDDPAVFESPEEDSQVIYGDHVFLY